MEDSRLPDAVRERSKRCRNRTNPVQAMPNVTPKAIRCTNLVQRSALLESLWLDVVLMGVVLSRRLTSAGIRDSPVKSHL